jgi:hypothetical protein
MLDAQSKLIDCGHIDLKNEKDPFKKLSLFNKFLDDFKAKHWDNSIVIYVETPLMMFSANQSSAQVISNLQHFNGMCCAAIYLKLGLCPKMVNASSARRLNGITVPRGVKAKEVVMHHIKEKKLIPDEKWEYKKTGKPKEHMKDVCDSYIISAAGLILEK